MDPEMHSHAFRKWVGYGCGQFFGRHTRWMRIKMKCTPDYGGKFACHRRGLVEVSCNGARAPSDQRCAPYLYPSVTVASAAISVQCRFQDQSVGKFASVVLGSGWDMKMRSIGSWSVIETEGLTVFFLRKRSALVQYLSPTETLKHRS